MYNPLPWLKFLSLSTEPRLLRYEQGIASRNIIQRMISMGRAVALPQTDALEAAGKQARNIL